MVANDQAKEHETPVAKIALKWPVMEREATDDEIVASSKPMAHEAPGTANNAVACEIVVVKPGMLAAEG